VRRRRLKYAVVLDIVRRTYASLTDGRDWGSAVITREDRVRGLARIASVSFPCNGIFSTPGDLERAADEVLP